MKTYLVFVIQGYEQKLEDGRLIDACEIQIIAENYDEAMERAKNIVTKSFYRLNMVIEKYAEK